jgi:hypothetical protein
MLLVDDSSAFSPQRTSSFFPDEDEALETNLPLEEDFTKGRLLPATNCAEEKPPRLDKLVVDAAI